MATLVTKFEKGYQGMQEGISIDNEDMEEVGRFTSGKTAEERDNLVRLLGGDHYWEDDRWTYAGKFEPKR